MRKKFNLMKFLPKVVVWLCLSTCAKPSLPIPLFEALITRLEKIESSRGQAYLVDYCKALRMSLMNYFSGNPFRPSEVKHTRDGIPVILGPLIESVRGRSYRVIAMIFTILFSTRSLSIGKDPDIQTITQPCIGDVNVVNKWMGHFWRDLGYWPSVRRVPRSLKVILDIYRLTNGPNGHALSTAILDAKALPKSLIDSLEVLGGQRIRDRIEGAAHPTVHSYLKGFYPSWFKHEDSPRFRRLSYFPDKEKKVRVVGILDWYSQACLKPLHNYLSRCLSKIPQDCTLDQGKFKSLILNNPRVDSYHSIDLTAATDRFPIQVIKNLLLKQLPATYVEAWSDIMVGYPFDFKVDEKISYSTGNPMGAYSSFNSFALAHHYIIYFCCKELGKCWKTLPYSLLGDDIVIGDRDVAGLYKKTISSLGVDFSPSKTHSSECFFEFAKRIYLDGVEISPFPVSSLRQSSKSFSMMTTLLHETNRKGWDFLDIPSCVGKFFSVVRDTRRSYVNKIIERSWQFEGVLLTVQGTLPVNEFINKLIKKLALPLPELNEEICKNIYVNCAVEAFSSSKVVKSVLNYDTRSPLEELTSKIESGWPIYSKDRLDPSSTPPSLNPWLFPRIPILCANIALMKEFHELIIRLEKMDSIGQDWTYSMRNLCLPIDASAFVGDRKTFTTARAVNQFYMLLQERMYVLMAYPQLLEGV
nr:MAG: RNA dependent RNA polymerase [Ustilaginoidea virens mitovirus 1]